MKMEFTQIFNILSWLIQVVTAIVVLVYTFISKREEYKQLKQRSNNVRQEPHQRDQ